MKVENDAPRRRAVSKREKIAAVVAFAAIGAAAVGWLAVAMPTFLVLLWAEHGQGASVTTEKRKIDQAPGARGRTCPRCKGSGQALFPMFNRARIRRLDCAFGLVRCWQCDGSGKVSAAFELDCDDEGGDHEKTT